MEENVKVENIKDQIDEIVKQAKEQFEFEANKDSQVLDFSKTTIYGNDKQVIALFTSYAKYSGEVETPKTIKKGVHGASYAPLNEVFDNIKPALSKNGLGLIQFPTLSADKVTINNILTHKDGGYISFESISARPLKADVQGIGGVITYLKRYSSSAIGGIASEPDDDGAGASGLDGNGKPIKTTTPKKIESPEEKLAKENKAKLDKVIKDIDKEVTRIVKIEKADAIAPIVMKDQPEKNFKSIKDEKIAKTVLAELKKVK